MERKFGDKFNIDIIADGTFQDEGYDIRTVIIRLSCTALNEWLNTDVYNCWDVYDTREEWELYKKTKDDLRKKWEQKVLHLLSSSNISEIEGYNISQNVTEIFTVVVFSHTPCSNGEERC